MFSCVKGGKGDGVWNRLYTSGEWTKRCYWRTDQRDGNVIGNEGFVNRSNVGFPSKTLHLDWYSIETYF